MRRKLISLSGLWLFLIAATGTAMAGTIGPNCGSGSCLGSTYTLTYSTTGTANVYDIFLTIDASGATLSHPGYLQDVSLKVSSSLVGTPTLLSSPSSLYGATETGGLSSSGCNGSGGGFFCNAYNGTGDGLAVGSSGDVYTWEWQVDTTSLFTGSTDASIKAQYVYSSGSTIKNDGITSADDSDTPSPSTPPVPEPSSLLLLGTGIATLAGTLKIKLFRGV